MVKGGSVDLGRLDVFWSFCYLFAGLIALRLFDLQVIRASQYLEAAERNRTQMIYQTAPRGRIYDSAGRVIAANEASFNLIYLPGKAKDISYLRQLASRMASLLDQSQEELLERLQEAFSLGTPVRLAENLPPSSAFKLAEIKTLYPGLDLVVEAKRHYPFGAFASHLVGYVGAMDPKSWSALRDQGYRQDSRIGRLGLEKLFESDMKGEDGGLQLEVDAQGRLQRVLSRIPWKPGSDVHLTLDAELQKIAEESLRASSSGAGAVVALDPRTGKVIVLASVPDFDPNLFSQKNIPEFNLALQGSYPPGSTFKIVTAAAALNEKKVSPQESFYCPGQFQLGRRVFRCWEEKGHGPMDFLKGTAHSCDVYYYHLGLRTGGFLLEKYERMFRIGQPAYIEIPGENRGLVFGPTERRRRHMPWSDGETLNLAIGQGELLVTPLQMANIASAVANRGTFWRSSVIEKVVTPEGQVLVQRQPEVLSRVPLHPETWDALQEGLKKAVEEGTGRGSQVPGIEVSGKTGTAQNPMGKDHAWFVAYAGLPREAPSLALAVVVQFGGKGAESAVPIARRVIEAYFRK